MDLWSQLHPDKPVPPSTRTEFPKWVEAPSGERVIVASRAEMTALLSGQDICPEPKRDSVPPPMLPEKSALQLQAQALGIEFDRRWGVKKLVKLIQEHRG